MPNPSPTGSQALAGEVPAGEQLPIRLYNTMTRLVEDFHPLEPRRVRMYTCGLTVYDYGHIGNYRTFVAVDILQRFLRLEGYEVVSVMNITDIDDKIIQRAQQAGQEIGEFAGFFERAFFDDLRALDIAPPTHTVRATEYVEAMIAWIEKLVASGHAYASEGSVYFRVESFPGYGKLSGKDLAGLQPGARVDQDEYDKEQLRDFALWKAHKPGEPHWESPWGPGRPGWHIECSVMSMKVLGDSFDLHAGGVDLIFPHHENEIAQAEAVTGKPFVRYWMHVEFLQVNGMKMSKSLGNILTPRELVVQGHRLSAIRYLLASASFRHQLNFTTEGLDQAHAALVRLRNFRDRLKREHLPEGHASGLAEAALGARNEMRAALADNLNTARAAGALFELVTLGNSAMDRGEFSAGNRDEFAAALDWFDRVFAVLDDHDGERAAIYGVALGISDAEIEALLKERAAARQSGDFARSDAIRKQLEDAGVVVEDIKGGGVRWRRK